MTNRLVDHQEPTESGSVKDGWATFAGEINSNTVNRIFNLFANATNNGYTHVHLIFQTTGGVIGDGIAIYNYLRSLPIEVTLYNVGQIASVGTVAFLGAKNRITSKHATFMIHRSYASPMQATSERMAAYVQSLALDDNRVESIFHEMTTLTDEHWAIHKNSDLWLSASDAVKHGVASSLGDFAPPLGTGLVNV
ncbi:MAG TPA: ATP-dependent Clp protease proteolytic subunit [Pseudaminobacter sp.]|nr:ATP-dependent Clp protease proteolytic subunit [Pseudaminobacter sp.]